MAGAGAVGVEDKEIIVGVNIVAGEGDFHSVLDFVDNLGKKVCHIFVFFGYTLYTARSVPRFRPGAYASYDSGHTLSWTCA